MWSWNSAWDSEDRGSSPCSATDCDLWHVREVSLFVPQCPISKMGMLALPALTRVLRINTIEREVFNIPVVGATDVPV